MRKHYLILFLFIFFSGSWALYAYDSTRVFTQYFGMGEVKVQRMFGPAYRSTVSSPGKRIFINLDHRFWDYGINFEVNSNWKVMAYETSRFGENDWKDSTAQIILGNEIEYLTQNGWKVKKKSVDENGRTEYLLKRGKKDEITVSYPNRWNFRIEQNLKTDWDW